MALFTDKEELSRQAKSRELHVQTDPKKVAMLKFLGYDNKGRTTGWGKVADFIDPWIFSPMRRGIAKKQLKGTDGGTVFKRTSDEYLGMNLAQHKFTADIFKTIFGGKGMGAGMGAMGGMMGKAGGAGGAAGGIGGATGSAGAGAGAGAGGGITSGLDSIGGAGGGAGGGGFMDMLGGSGSNIMKAGNTASQVQQGVSAAGEGIAGAIDGDEKNKQEDEIGTDVANEAMNDNVFDTGEDSMAGGTAPGMKKTFPSGARIVNGQVVDKDGNPLDLEAEGEEYNEDQEGKNKENIKKFVKGVTDPNADLIGSFTDMTTKAFDYYNTQGKEVNRLRKQRSSSTFNYL